MPLLPADVLVVGTRDLAQRSGSELVNRRIAASRQTLGPGHDEASE